ncbi:hypothetical protein BC831DRAFT_454187 [Entophlyctis helioformis]|nr:hypothetical protein BC831DRAFT_454187 [Entophlyctis helioformis]
MLFNTIAIVSLAATASAYSLCNAAVNPYANRTLSIPIVGARATGANNAPLTVSGTISVVDGCTFSINNLAFSGVPAIVIFGGVPPDTNGVRLAAEKFTAPAPGAPINRNVTFISTAGNWVSYTDFVQFRLFDEDNQLLVATADIPNPITPSTARTAAASVSVPASVPTARPSVQPSAVASLAPSAATSAPAAAKTTAATTNGSPMRVHASLTASLSLVLVMAAVML